MRHLLATGLLTLFLVSGGAWLDMGTPPFAVEKVEAAVRVKGYYRKDGTYVRPHYRSNPDGNPFNNWSYPGNTNPYTGETATGNPDTYLRNYYDRTGGSNYSTSCYEQFGFGSISDSSGGCICSSGYVLRDGKCVSTYSLCDFMETYNEQTGSCDCWTGYLRRNSDCVSEFSYCWDQYGMGSHYDRITGQCECDASHRMRNGKCELYIETTNYEDLFDQRIERRPSTPSCGPNAYSYDGGCYCNVGYKPNSAGKCLWSDAASTFDRCEQGTCYCKEGNVIRNDRCMPDTVHTETFSDSTAKYIQSSKERLSNHIASKGGCLEIKTVWIDSTMKLKKQLEGFVPSADKQNAIDQYTRFLKFLQGKYNTCLRRK